MFQRDFLAVKTCYARRARLVLCRRGANGENAFQHKPEAELALLTEYFMLNGGIRMALTRRSSDRR